jgi:Mg2+-importing ATPase
MARSARIAEPEIMAGGPTVVASRQTTDAAPKGLAAPIGISAAATLTGADVLREQEVSSDRGLTEAEARRRLALWGPNVVSSHRARLWPVLWH